MAKTLTPNEMNFVQTMLMNGYSLQTALSLLGKSTEDRSEASHNANKVSNFIKADKSASTKSTTKGSKDKKAAPKGAKTDTKSKFGKVKVGDFFKVVVDKDGKATTTRIGKADKLDLKDKILTATNGKKYALEKCITISKAEYGKLKKKLKVSEAKPAVSTSTKLTPKDYKVVYCFNLTKLGKVTEEEFAKAKTDDQVASELYKKFKDEVKLSNSEAIKLLAENSAKEQPQA